MLTVGKVFNEYAERYLAYLRGVRTESSYNSSSSCLADIQLFDFSALLPNSNVINALLDQLNVHLKDVEGKHVYTMDQDLYTYEINIPSSVYEFKLELPFQSSFILLDQKKKSVKALHIEEYNRTEYMLTLCFATNGNPVDVRFYAVHNAEDNSYTFIFFTSKKIAHDDGRMRSIAEATYKNYIEDVILTDYFFSRLAEYYYTRLEDVSKPFYIRSFDRKNATKVSGKPIYILLSEKTKNKNQVEDLEKKYPQYKIMHSFPVRGHWRRLQDLNSIGKDRRGEYNQKGFTWVKECMKGSGELIPKRPYVILPGKQEDISNG